MKNAIIISTLFFSLSLFSCEESELGETNFADLTGIYEGALNSTANLNEAASAEISFLTEDQILFHCYSTNFDSTVVLNLYSHHDTVKVCLNGDEFEREYGHRMGQHHMMHGDNSFESSWKHHLSDEHHQNDRHYGFYHNYSHMFHFTFRMQKDQSYYDLTFEGVKQ